MSNNIIPHKLDAISSSAIKCRECFADRRLVSAFIDVAQPRYIGGGYWHSDPRVAFVMLNPGAGKGDWRNEDWRDHLYAYRAKKESLQEIFDAIALLTIEHGGQCG